MLGRVARTSGCLQRTSIFAGTLAAFVLALPSLPIPAMAANGRVVVPRATIYPGSAITEGMLGEVNLDRETDNFGQPLATREQVVGKVARRTLLPGQPIGLNSLRAPFAVVSGKMVAIVYTDASLTITGRALAMQNGAVGDTITVQNVDSNAIIRGKVTADGAVEIGD